MNKYKKNRRNNRNKRNKKKKNTWASEYKQLHQGWSWCLWISRTWDRECEGIQHDLFQVCRPPVASLLPSGDQARLHTCKKQRLKQKNQKAKRSKHKPDGGTTIGTINASQPCRLHPVCMVSGKDHNWQTCADLRTVQCFGRQFFTPVRTKHSDNSKICKNIIAVLPKTNCTISTSRS